MKYFSSFVNSDQNKNEYDDEEEKQESYIKISINVNNLEHQAAKFVQFMTCYQQWFNFQIEWKKQKRPYSIRIILGDFNFY